MRGTVQLICSVTTMSTSSTTYLRRTPRPPRSIAIISILTTSETVSTYSRTCDFHEDFLDGYVLTSSLTRYEESIARLSGPTALATPDPLSVGFRRLTPSSTFQLAQSRISNVDHRRIAHVSRHQPRINGISLSTPIHWDSLVKHRVARQCQSPCWTGYEYGRRFPLPHSGTGVASRCRWQCQCRWKGDEAQDEPGSDYQECTEKSGG